MKPAIFHSLKGYTFRRFVNDLMSGILVAIIALPLSIALGIQSGVTIQQGLITAVVGGFLISLLGGSRFQIGGPTAAFVAIIVGYISDPQIGLLGLQVATVMAGIIMLLMSIFRVGGLIKYIPYPIVIGFTSGIGITLLVGQLKDFFGMEFIAGGHSFTDKIFSLFTNFDSLSWATLAIGLTTIAIMLILPKINKKIPAAFVALLVTTIITVIVGRFNDFNYGIATIESSFGAINAEFYFPNFKAIGGLNFGALIVPSIVIAFLASVESLLSCKVADGLTNTLTDSNAELMAQGVANIASALMGGIPATGAIARTAANIRNGATSSLSGIIHAITLMIIFFIAMPLVSYIPMASLAAVLIIVSLGMANLRQFGRLLRYNARDFLILATTFLMTVCYDLVFGVVGGLAMTVLVYLPQIIRGAQFVTVDSTRNVALGIIPATDTAYTDNTYLAEHVSCPNDDIPLYGIGNTASHVAWQNIYSDDNPDTLIQHYITTIHASGSLNFINIHRLLRLINIQISGKKELLLNFRHLENLDLSVAEGLAKLIYKLCHTGQNLMIINAKPRLMRQIVLAQQQLTTGH